MKIYRLHRTQAVKASQATCWDFFSNPYNLAKVTPAEFDLQLDSHLPSPMYPGMLFGLKVRPLFGIQLQWFTEITHLHAPDYFVDQSVTGPYRLWHHQHWFRPINKGGSPQELGCLIEDIVHYALPFDPFGRLAHGFLVAPQLQRIFDFRQKKAAELFGELEQ